MAGDRRFISVHLITDGKAGHRHMGLGVLKRLDGGKETLWTQSWWFTFAKGWKPQFPISEVDAVIFVGARTMPLVLGFRKTPVVCVALTRPVSLLTPFFSLICLPRHDFRSAPESPFFPLRIAPSFYTLSELEKESSLFLLKKRISPEKKRICILIGGNTKTFRLSYEPLHLMFTKILRWKKESGYEILCTTSRRTPPEIEERIEKEFAPKFEDWVPALKSGENPVPAYLGLAHKAVVTEDSFLMVSEALSAGKDLWILRLGLKRKMTRSYQLLAEEEGVFWAFPEEGESFLKREKKQNIIDEAERIAEKIRCLVRQSSSSF
ncbi:MAG: ELM1/GtrOC1 family putative glycosyltransferase [bacterium JZ-2024 1]